MKESGEAVYKLAIVERLSLLAVILFGVVSFTTSRMVPEKPINLNLSSEDVLAAVELESVFDVKRDDIEVPVAGGVKSEREERKKRVFDSEEELKQEKEAEAELRAQAEAEAELRAQAEAEAELRVQAMMEAEAQETARMKEEEIRQAEMEARAARQAWLAAENARVAEENARKTAEVEAQRIAAEAAAQKAAAEQDQKSQVDYSKIVYVDDNGENIDNGEVAPALIVKNETDVVE